jgi:trehalose 6-phosphate synthase
MNLVAKEYVAAQDPADPGVLVLSQFAGAANELTSAHREPLRGMTWLMLNRALTMPLTERISRHAEMMEDDPKNDINHWQARFIQDLREITPQSHEGDLQKRSRHSLNSPDILRGLRPQAALTAHQPGLTRQ